MNSKSRNKTCVSYVLRSLAHHRLDTPTGPQPTDPLAHLRGGDDAVDFGIYEEGAALRLVLVQPLIHCRISCRDLLEESTTEFL